MSKTPVYIHFKNVEKRDREICTDSLMDFLTTSVSLFAMRNMKFKHVELAIPCNRLSGSQMGRLGLIASRDEHVSFTVFRQSSVTVSSRKYSSTEYARSLVIYATTEEVDSLIDFANHERNHTNYGQSFFDVFLWPSRADDGYYFCTKFVVRALQELGFMKGKNPSEFLADDIYIDMLDQGARIEPFGTPTSTVMLSDSSGIRSHLGGKKPK